MKATRAVTAILIVIAAMILLAGTRPAAAIPIFVSWGDEKVVKIAEFPNTEKFKTPDGKHIDAGYRYKQVSVFFIPLLNYGGQWCGYIGDSDHYLNIDKADLTRLASMQFPDDPKLPPWDSYGGKLLLLLATVVFVLIKTAHRASA